MQEIDTNIPAGQPVCDFCQTVGTYPRLWLKERYTLAHCEQHEKLVERYMSALQDWAYFAYPQNECPSINRRSMRGKPRTK
jgi:hypothetical protein